MTEQHKQKQPQPLLPVTGCLYVAILVSLLTILVKECKRVDLRLKQDKIKYEYFMDSMQKINR